MKYLKFASKNGDVDAMFYYSKIIANKERSTSDELSDMENLIDLYADILSTSLTLPQDKVKAARYYKMSADLGSNYAMVRYARCLSEGNGVEVNQEESLKYFQKSTDGGDLKSMVVYASKLRERGEGSYDENEVFKYYKKAIEIGDELGEVDLREEKQYIANLNP